MSPEILAWFSSTWIGETMRGTYWMWPLMENLHFLGLSVMLGALMVIDLRVLGLAKFIPMKPAMHLIPLALVAFFVNLLTGIAFFAGAPQMYASNVGFQWKMGLIVLAGFNALWFWFGEHARLVQLADGEDAQFQAKMIAGLSLIIWVGVIVLGRLIPYMEY